MTPRQFEAVKRMKQRKGQEILDNLEQKLSDPNILLGIAMEAISAGSMVIYEPASGYVWLIEEEDIRLSHQEQDQLVDAAEELLKNNRLRK